MRSPSRSTWSSFPGKSSDLEFTSWLVYLLFLLNGYGLFITQVVEWLLGEEFRSHPWFADTVFMIVADHCAGSAGRTELPLYRYQILLFIYAPGHVEPRVVDTLASQIDIAPTLLGLLGVPCESRFFGKDILRMAPEEGRALIANYQRLGLFRGEKMVYLSPKKRIEIVDDPSGFATVYSEIRDEDRELVDDTISFYQGASDLFDRKLYDR